MPGGGMNFELTEDQELIRKSVAELARKFDDQYWMEKDQAHEFPTEFYQRHRRRRLAGHDDSDRVRRPRTRNHRSHNIARGGRQIRRRHERRQLDPPVDLRHATGGGARLRRTQGAHAAPGRDRRGARLFRGDRTRCRARHFTHHHVRQTRRGPLHRQRPQGVDLQSDGVRQDLAADPDPDATRRSPRRPTG